MLNEELKLSNVATWWCGQEREREQVLGAFGERAISVAFLRERLPGFGERRHRARLLSWPDAERQRLIDAINQRGVDYVGQESVKLSTTPAWTDGRLAPRSFALRVDAAATADGWTVMPGGLLSGVKPARSALSVDGRRRTIERRLGADEPPN